MTELKLHNHSLAPWVLLASALFSNAALAQSHGIYACQPNGHCYTEEEMVQRIIDAQKETAKQPSCKKLSIRDAQKAAQQSYSGNVDLESFNLVYGETCDFDHSLEAAETPKKARDYLELLNSSKDSDCVGLSPEQALKAVTASSQGQLDVASFKTAYGSTCFSGYALEAGKNQQRAQAFVDILEFTRNNGCQRPDLISVLRLAELAERRKVNVQAFNRAFRASCQWDDSIKAAANVSRSNSFVALLTFAKKHRCKKPTSKQALIFADAVSDGMVMENYFEQEYAASCDFADALLASETLTLSLEVHPKVASFLSPAKGDVRTTAVSAKDSVVPTTLQTGVVPAANTTSAP